MKKTYLKLIAMVLTAVFIVAPLFTLGFTAYAETGTDYSNFTVVIDYYAEMLRIVPGEGGKSFIEVGTASDSVRYEEKARNFAGNVSKFMYALKAPSAELLDSYKPAKKNSTLLNEKWYPIYGTGIDISKSIPKKPITDVKKYYNIAIRLADDLCVSNSAYPSRITVQLKSRYYDKDLSKSIIYDAEAQKFILTGTGSLNVFYTLDYFTSAEATLTSSAKNNNIYVPVSSFSSGGNLSIKTAPILNGDGVQYAASAVMKYKIPKAANIPAVKVDSSKLALSSLKKNTTEWTTDPSNDDWTTYTDTATTLYYKDIPSKLTAFRNMQTTQQENSTSETDPYYYVLYFRTKAVAKKSPASEIKKIYIPIEEAMAATE